MPKSDSPFYVEGFLDLDNVEKAMTKGEKMYVKYEKSIGKSNKALEDQEAQAEKTGKKSLSWIRRLNRDKNQSWRSERREFLQRQKYERKEGRRKRRIEMGGFFRRGARSAGSAGRVIAGAVTGPIAGMLGIGAVIGGIIGAIRAYFRFDKVVRSLNTTMGDNAAIMRTSSSMVQGLTGYLDLSREEIAAMTRQLGDLRITMNQKAFRQLTMDTIHLSKSMDVASGSVIDLFDTFDKIYGLPHHRFRNIAASLKFVQEQSGLTGEEVIGLAKSFEDLLARVTAGAKGAKETALVEMTAMAGAMKKVGIDITPLGQMFSESLKEHSEKGALYLSSIVENTGFTMDEVQKRMRAGDMILPLELTIQKLKRLTPEYIRINEERLEEELGLNFAQMMRLRKLRVGDVRVMVKQAKIEAKRATLHKKRALATQAAIERVWNRLKRAWEKLVLTFGGMLARLLERYGKPMTEWLIGIIQRFEKWIAVAVDPSKGGKLTEWLESAWGWIKKQLWPAMVDVGRAMLWIVGQVKKLIEWWNSLSKTEKSIVAWATAIGAAFAALTAVGGPIGGLIALIGALTAAGKKLIDEYYAPRLRMIRESMRWMEKEQQFHAKERVRKLTIEEVKALGTAPASVSRQTLRTLMVEGTITKAGKVQMMPWMRNRGDMIMLQKLLDKQLGKMDKYANMIEGSGMLTKSAALEQAARMANIAQTTIAGGTAAVAAATTPTVTPAVPPSPVTTTVVAETPTQNKLLTEIRDALYILKRERVNPAVHPSARPLESQL